MSRPIFLSNGSLTVGIDKTAYLQEFYYPYVGLENHTNAKQQGHRIGLWVEGSFTWLDDGTWQIDIDYSPDGLIGNISAVNPGYRIRLDLTDFIDAELNVFARKIKITNEADTDREVRLFMHQVFLISESKRDVTCQYLPHENVVMHYRGRRVFLIGGEHADGQGFDQYTIGMFGTEGHDGTFRDAEDGELSGNNVEHGMVDSTIRFRQVIRATKSAHVRYYVSAGMSVKSAMDNHHQMQGDGFNQRLELTQEHWQKWQGRARAKIGNLDPHYREPVRKSMLIVKSHIDRRGGVIASGDSEMLNYWRDYYSYCWPRDASFVLWPMIRLGHYDEAQRYFEFARDVINPEGYLSHKYQTDRSLGSSWHPYIHNGREELPIQEDETAITIYLLKEYLKASGDEDFVKTAYNTLVQPAANWLDSYIDSETKLPHASYDLWEEKFLTTTYTVGTVYGALQAASELADLFEYPDDAIRWRSVADDIRESARDTLFNHERGYFYKGFLLNRQGMLEYDSVIDVSSLYGAVMFGLYDIDDDYVKTAAKTLESTLLDRSVTKGLPRYENDAYHRTRPDSLGNIWPVVTLWYAQFLIETGQKDRAREIVDWAIDKMLPSGVLPEQLDPDNSNHVSVSPLIWSQAEFINTVLDLGGEG